MNPALEMLLIGPTLLLAFLIYANFNKANTIANKWLSAFIFCIFLIQISSPLDKLDDIPSKFIITGLLNLISFIIAPVYYFTIIYFTEPGRRWKFKDNIHFLLPFLILLLTTLSFFTDKASTTTIEEKELESNIVKIFTILFSILIMAYCVITYRKIRRHQKNSFQYSSNIQSVSLKWLQQVSVCILLLTLIWLLDTLFDLSSTSLFFDVSSSTITCFGIFFIAFHSLKQKEVFPFGQKEKREVDAIINENTIPENYRKKLIPDAELSSWKAQLIQFMDQEKPYLDFELSVIKLASQLKITPHILSYIINSGFNQNFYLFINTYRINEAKKLILDPKKNHINLLGIAYEVGFNSKTVFNTTFKKMTNKTPTEFKNKIKTTLNT